MSPLAASHHNYLKEVPSEPPPEESAGKTLAMHEISVLILAIGCVAIAWAFPFKSVKYGLIIFFGILMIVQTMRRPAMGLAMLVFGSPAMSLVPPGMIPIRGLNAETLLIAMAIFIWVRQNQIAGKDDLRTPLGRWLLVYALLILMSCVVASLFWQSGLFDTMQKAKNHLAFMIFLPVGFHVLRERRDQMLVLMAATASLMLNCGQAINEGMIPFLAGNLERARAMALIAQQPNTFGAALAVYLPFVVSLTLNRVGGKALNLWFLVASGLVGFALILTLSRGGWVGAVGALLVIALFKDRRLLVLLVLAVATFNLWAPEAVKERLALSGQTSGDIGVDDQIVDDSAQMRVEQYKSLPAMMAPSPIIGHGYKSYPYVFEKYGTLKRFKGAHSTYCQVGTEEGLLGLAVLGAVFVMMLAAGWRAQKYCEDPLHRCLGAGVFAGTVAMALAMLFGARWEPQIIMAFFWVLAGVAEREGILARDRAQAPRTPLMTVQR